MDNSPLIAPWDLFGICLGPLPPCDGFISLPILSRLTMSKKIDAIAEVAAENFTNLLREAADDIQAAMIKATEEAALQEGEAKFNIGFTVLLNLDRNIQTHKLAWTVRNVRETECEIPDANQDSLAL